MLQKRYLLLNASGGVMFAIFALNVYVGLGDRNLFYPPNYVLTPHYYFNWVITAIDLTSSGLLLLRSARKDLAALAGIVWPTVYFVALGLDVATRLCLGAAPTTCFPSPDAAASYLFLGNSSVSTVYLWPYTFTLIALLLACTMLLCILGLRTPLGESLGAPNQAIVKKASNHGDNESKAKKES